MTITATAHSTKLEAVNAMLFDIGERTVSTLTSPTRQDVIRAIDTLDYVLRETLTSGWWFNRETAKLNIDGSNQYVPPTTAVNIEVISGGPTSGTVGVPKLVFRDGVLYDVVNGTDTFTNGPELTIRFHRLLDYEVIPQTARRYVFAVASIRFQSRTLGSRHVDQDLRVQAAGSLAALQQQDVDNEEINTTSYAYPYVNLMHNR